jgi:hypothetical protein
MAAIQTPGLNPSILVAPDYQTQMLAAQRRLELANALSQQAMSDTPGNGGSVSWTQGLARIMDAIASKRTASQGYKQMQGANQAYAAGLARMFGMQPPQMAPSPQTAQGAPVGPSATPMPQAAPQAPQAASAPPVPFVPGQPPAPGQADPLAPLPPPQAAAPQPSAPPPAPTGGGPFSLTGDPQRDMMLYLSNPDEFSKQMVDVAAKGATPLDPEIMVARARQALASGDIPTATALLGALQKNNYIAPVSGRPGGVILDPITKKPIFQTPRIGENQAVTFDENGHPAQVYNIPGALQSAEEQAAAVAGGQASARAPYDVIQVWDPNKNAFVTVPKSSVTGGIGATGSGPLSTHYQGVSGGLQSSPSLGAQSAANTYGAGSANAFLSTQDIAETSPQRVQALREMQSLINGPNALATGPTAAKMQEIAEKHGLPFGYSNNAFVFNKDAARFIAQNASDLGLNGSDARLGMMANASPNMKMTAPALKVVIPTMIGLEYAKMAKATAAATWAQHSPQTNAQFESTWRQNYDPRMFTAYAEGGPAALARAPANLRAQWLKDYRALKGMGVDFTQFAQ